MTTDMPIRTRCVRRGSAYVLPSASRDVSFSLAIRFSDIRRTTRETVLFRHPLHRYSHPGKSQAAYELGPNSSFTKNLPLESHIILLAVHFTGISCKSNQS